MSEQTLPRGPQHRVPPFEPGGRHDGPPDGPGPTRPGWRRAGWIGAAIGVLVVIALVVALIWRSDEDDGTTSDTTAPTTATTSTSTTVATTSTTEATTTTTVAPLPGVDVASALYPFAGGEVRFDDPVALATAFATDYVGFTDPVVGDFMPGDARSGEVEVRATADGPVTTVFVRQLGPGNSWWVLGAATDAIAVDRPEPGAAISSPVTVSGSALAWEGAVAVEVRQDGVAEPIGTGVVTGGGDVMRPFRGEVAFTAPTQPYGAMVFLTHSARDGLVREAAVFRVRFA